MKALLVLVLAFFVAVSAKVVSCPTTFNEPTPVEDYRCHDWFTADSLRRERIDEAESKLDAATVERFLDLLSDFMRDNWKRYRYTTHCGIFDIEEEEEKEPYVTMRRDWELYERLLPRLIEHKLGFTVSYFVWSRAERLIELRVCWSWHDVQ